MSEIRVDPPNGFMFHGENDFESAFFHVGFFPIFKAQGHERSEVGVPRCAPVSSAPERHLPRTVKKMLRSQIYETTDVCKEPRVPNLGIYILYIYYCLCLSGILSISALLHLLIAWFFFDFRS